MATQQLQPVTLSQDVPKARPVVVYIKRLWTDPWQLSESLEAVSVTLGVGVNQSAQVKLNYGKICRPDDADFQLYTSLDSVDWFVQIRDVSDTGVELVLFTGILVRDQLDPHGGDVELNDVKVDSGDQQFNCDGLAYLLTKQKVTHAWCKEFASEMQIDHVPPINGGDGGGLIANRTPTVSATAGVHRFYADMAAASLWTHKDVVDMALHDYVPSDAPFTLGGLGADLLDDITTALKIEGKTVAEILDLLIDRRRGLLWRVGDIPAADSSETAGWPIVIEVSTVYSEPITVGDVTLQPAVTSVICNLAALGSDVQGQSISLTRCQTYDAITVRGKRIVSCFSVGLDATEEGTALLPAWKSAQETAYLAAASATSGYAELDEDEQKTLNDRTRGDEKFTNVFRGFRMPSAWNWKDGWGTIINPKCNDLGWLVETGEYEGDGDPPADYDNGQGGYYNANKTFLKELPLKVGVDYTTNPPVDGNPSGTAARYLAPLVWITYNPDPDDETSTSVVVQVDRIYEAGQVLSNLSVTVMHNCLGLKIGASPNHLLALNRITGTLEPSHAEPKLDYMDLVTTVAVETDQRLRVRVVAAGAADNPRELFIDVPWAELWWLAPGTYVGLDPTDGTKLKQSPSVGMTLRTDRVQLQAIAAAALAWYSKQRQTVAIKVMTLDHSVRVGQYITALTSSQTRAQIETVVTEVTYDLGESQSTTVKTQFQELDFSGFGKGKSQRGLSVDESPEWSGSGRSLSGSGAGEVLVRPAAPGAPPETSVLAITQEASPAANKIKVKRIGADGNPTGNEFDAYGIFTDAATQFSDVKPFIFSGKKVLISRRDDGNWYLDMTLEHVGDECPE